MRTADSSYIDTMLLDILCDKIALENFTLLVPMKQYSKHESYIHSVKSVYYQCTLMGVE
jgi:hypothetical protein